MKITILVDVLDKGEDSWEVMCTGDNHNLKLIAENIVSAAVNNKLKVDGYTQEELTARTPTINIVFPE